MPKGGDKRAIAERGLDETRSGLHVAIIMDGNGRWAKARGLPRTLGHRAGVKALKATVAAAAELGIGCLTVFGFSTENWNRPAQEVNDLMGLLKAFVDSDLDRLHQEGVRVRVLGRRDGLGADVLATIARAESLTKANDRFLLQVAFNYGGRADITDAARHFAYVFRQTPEQGTQAHAQQRLRARQRSLPVLRQDLPA